MSTTKTHPDIDVLGSDGLPIFFAMPDAGTLGLALPENRHGQSVRVWARSLAGMQKEALIASARTGRVWRLASDEGPYLHGFDRAPCPLSFMTTGMVCSYMSEILAAAQSAGARIRDIELVQDNFYTMQGSALQGTMTGGALPVELAVRLDCDADEESVHRLVTRALAAAPVSGLLGARSESRFALTLNGREIPVGRVRALGRAAEVDPGEKFCWPRALPAGQQQSGLIEKLRAVTPEEGPGGTGTSLSAVQDRRLHVRGTCRLRPDGAKEVEQVLFSPRGSAFRFLCDEAAGHGGHGLAPDAATYIAAGIAFCFMTQLGRYASIVRRNLDAYRVIQDIHFSPGGVPASNGVADPVETHVFLEADEDEAFARTLVDMGEQTCFLHAFCRTPLETRLRIERTGGG